MQTAGISSFTTAVHHTRTLSPPPPPHLRMPAAASDWQERHQGCEAPGANGARGVRGGRGGGEVQGSVGDQPEV